MKRKKNSIILVLFILLAACFVMLAACKKCNHSVTYEQTVVEPDCESAGLINIVCEKCAETVDTKTVEALEHKYGDWNITENPTLYVDGKMQRVCERNPLHTETQSVPKLQDGNSYTVAVTEQPTCSAKGKIKYTSSVYGTYECDIPADLHTYDESKEGYCKECGKQYYTVGLKYSLSDDGTYYIISNGQSNTLGTNIIIPHSYKNLPVKEIGYEAFVDKNITSVTIPEYIEKIGSGAFNGSKLTKVNFNAINCDDFNQKNWVFLVGTKVELTVGCRVEHIPARMFYPLVTQDRTVNLTKITFEENSVCKSIGEYAFNKTNLTELTLPDSLETIGDNAFYNTDISNLSVGSNVTVIGKFAFGACEKLVNVRFGKSLKQLCEDSFNYCTKLSAVDLSDTQVVSIDGDAFKGCSAVKNVKLPDTLTHIGKQAFYGCSSMTDLDLGTGLQYISEQAFAECNKLTAVTVPQNVTEIGNGAFSNCESLSSIKFCAVRCKDLAGGNMVFANIGKENGVNVEFGSEVERIPARLFYASSNSAYLPAFNKVTLGNKIESIGDYAFFGISVTEAVYSGNLTEWQKITIGDGNSSLSSVIVK